jgi:hypothetical protein
MIQHIGSTLHLETNIPKPICDHAKLMLGMPSRCIDHLNRFFSMQNPFKFGGNLLHRLISF